MPAKTILARLARLMPRTPIRPTGKRTLTLLRGCDRLEDRIAPALAFDPAAQTALRDTLLNGVGAIGDFGAEGVLAVYGDDAAGILRDNSHNPIVAAVHAGATRAVLAAKYEFATFSNSAVANTEQFYLNIMSWLGEGAGPATRIVTDISAARNWLVARGFTSVTLTSGWETALGAADVLITDMDNPSTAKQNAAISFLAGGGNLFAGANGWSSPTPGGNVVLRTLSLAWSGDYSDSFNGTILRGTPAANAALAPDVIANTASSTTAQQVEAARAIRSVARVAELAALAPVTVTEVAVNDGAAQRSRVTSLRVAFSGLVGLPANPATAFTVAGPAGPVGLAVDTSASTATQTIVRLTFTGPGLQGGSLADGLYSLQVLGDQLADAFGARIDADGNGQPGGTRVVNFHRLFGDADGNGTVSLADFLAFRLAFLQPAAALTFDANADFLAFRLRFLTSI